PKAKDRWNFEVRTDVPGREVTLSWRGDGVSERLRNMRLVDVESGKAIKVIRNGAVGTYTLAMPGTIHRFKWVYRYKK
ncbi:unnamed protein product, partial [Hapterophycus canaliculatus]